MYRLLPPSENWITVNNNNNNCVGDKIEKNEMGGACGAYGGGERGVQGSGGEGRGKEAIGETQT